MKLTKQQLVASIFVGLEVDHLSYGALNCTPLILTKTRTACIQDLVLLWV